MGMPVLPRSPLRPVAGVAKSARRGRTLRLLTSRVTAAETAAGAAQRAAHAPHQSFPRRLPSDDEDEAEAMEEEARGHVGGVWEEVEEIGGPAASDDSMDGIGDDGLQHRYIMAFFRQVRALRRETVVNPLWSEVREGDSAEDREIQRLWQRYGRLNQIAGRLVRMHRTFRSMWNMLESVERPGGRDDGDAGGSDGGVAGFSARRAQAGESDGGDGGDAQYDEAPGQDVENGQDTHFRVARPFVLISDEQRAELSRRRYERAEVLEEARALAPDSSTGVSSGEAGEAGNANGGELALRTPLVVRDEADSDSDEGGEVSFFLQRNQMRHRRDYWLHLQRSREQEMQRQQERLRELESQTGRDSESGVAAAAAEDGSLAGGGESRSVVVQRFFDRRRESRDIAARGREMRRPVLPPSEVAQATRTLREGRGSSGGEDDDGTSSDANEVVDRNGASSSDGDVPQVTRAFRAARGSSNSD